MTTYGVSQDVIPGNLTIQGNLLQSAIVDNITAKAGGGQQTSGPSVIPPNITYFRVNTVGSAADSITLPSAGSSGLGDEVVVINAAAANSMNVFPSVGDNINNLAANSAFAVAAGKSCSFFLTSLSINTGVGRWNTMLGA